MRLFLLIVVAVFVNICFADPLFDENDIDLQTNEKGGTKYDLQHSFGGEFIHRLVIYCFLKSIT